MGLEKEHIRGLLWRKDGNKRGSSLSFSRSVLLLFLAGSFSKFISIFYRAAQLFARGGRYWPIPDVLSCFRYDRYCGTGGLPMSITKHMAEQIALNDEETALQIFQVGHNCSGCAGRF